MKYSGRHYRSDILLWFILFCAVGLAIYRGRMASKRLGKCISYACGIGGGREARCRARID